ncbi:MAG: sterol desaturase family protein [Gammaproteobacteria bacterium]
MQHNADGIACQGRQYSDLILHGAGGRAVARSIEVTRRGREITNPRIDAPETNSNFGFNLPWWDRLFGTYRAQPRLGHGGMTLGIEAFRDPGLCTGIFNLLRLPFLGDAQSYPINRRR